MKSAILSAFVLIPALAVASDAVPAPPQKQAVALVNGTIHPVSSPAIEDAAIVFEKGKITAVGKDAAIPDDAKVVDLAGRHVYPGLFEAMSDIGLIEINSVRATNDKDESGNLNPNVKSWVSVNPDSEVIPVTRSNGVLLALSAPSGELLAGQAAVLQLDGWTWEDMIVKAPVGLVVTWPDVDKPEDEPHQELDRLFNEARAYATARKANEDTPADLRYEALLPVLERKVPLIVDADELAQIQSAVAFAEKHHVRLILYGGYDAARCAHLLSARDVPVIVGGVYRLPQRRSDPYDAPYTLPERLRTAGVKFCISGANRFGSSNIRNLPYHAATAAAYGLPTDEALRAVTLSPAEILGVADQVGSLDVGKDATLMITTGNPLEANTQVTNAYVQGRLLDLTDRHKQLYEKYRTKYDRQEGQSDKNRE